MSSLFIFVAAVAIIAIFWPAVWQGPRKPRDGNTP
jgi:hypothetical protein